MGSYVHVPKCPAYGEDKWKDVTECGMCDILRDRDEED